MLPFSITVGGHNIVFDHLESSPVYVSDSSDTNCRASHVSPSYGGRAGRTVLSVVASSSEVTLAVVEMDAVTAFEVYLPTNLLNEVLSQCQQCYGCAQDGERCSNKRRPAGRKHRAPVWCYHHIAQECLFQRFLSNGERPPECVWWWEEYDSEKHKKGEK